LRGRYRFTGSAIAHSFYWYALAKWASLPFSCGRATAPDGANPARRDDCSRLLGIRKLVALRGEFSPGEISKTMAMMSPRRGKAHL
jgi:hypothetical protein